MAVLLLCCLAFVCAAPGAVAEESAETVRVAVIDYPNYIQMNADGTVSGYAYEYLQSIQKYTGWQYSFEEMSFAEATTALENGEIDLLAGNQYTEARAEKFDYSKRDMGEGGSVLCVRPDDMRYCYNDYAAYDGLRIAALAGSVRTEQAKEKLAQYGAEAVFVEYETDEESKAALERGEVDAVLMSTIRCETKYKILARLNSAPLYFCTNKQRPQLKTQLDDAMETIHLESPYYEEKLDEKYYGSIPVQLAFTAAEQEYIRTAGPVTVALSTDLMPLEYYSQADQSFHGVVPDTFRLLADYSGLTFRFTQREDTAALVRQLTEGDVQLVSSVAANPGTAAALGVTLSDPYRENSVSIVLNEGVSDYKSDSCTVVVRSGYPYLEQLAQASGYTHLQHAATFDACLAQVEKGTADLTLIPSNCAESLLHSGSYTGLNTCLMPDSNMDFCIGAGPSTDPLLLSILNKSIASISKEQLSELLVQNLTLVSENVTLRGFVRAHRSALFALALGLAAVMVAGACTLAARRQRTNRQLTAALAKADAASSAKTEFLARMSHDMRTPMNGILGLSYLMEGQTDLAEIKKELPKLRHSGEYLLQLINDVLDVNRAEIGKIELKPKECNEEEVFDSIISMMQPLMDKKNIDFHFTKINIEWTYMRLDAQRVKQIFVNLLSNAVKFTPEGGRVDFIMELVSEDEHTIRDKFIVRDTGIGMEEGFLPRLFEPFAQENRGGDNGMGTGLGLSIVKTLVELMDGEITVKSRVDEGTEFTLYLNFPLAPRPEEKPTAEPAAPRLPWGLNILLCEDQPLNAQIATRLLQKQGAQVTWAQNGQLGVEAFACSVQGEYDVVLMDIRMPVLDGLGAARAIRALPRPDAKVVPILAMTANAYAEDVQKSLEAGMNAHLAKPIDPPALFAEIVKQVEQRPKTE